MLNVQIKYFVIFSLLTFICKADLRCVNRAGAVWPQWGMWDSCWGRGCVSCWAGAAVRKTAALRTAAAPLQLQL